MAWSTDSALRVMTLVVALASAVCVLALIAGQQPADAAFPGKNGEIAFVSDRNGHWDIYVMDADGSNQTNLTTDLSLDSYWPVWSPDGTKIAFNRGEDAGEIYVMDADGSNVTRLTNNSLDDWNPDWSPDSARIAFNSRRATDGTIEIHVMNADGTDKMRLTDDSHDDWDQPDWSPDGTKIAFTSARDSDYEVYTMDADGSGVTRLTNNSTFEWLPDWQPLPGPPLPQTRAQCKKGGWREFGFQNQGKCIAFVNRAAHNQ